MTEQLKAQEEVVRLVLTWQDNALNDTISMKPGMKGPGSAMGSGMGGSRSDRPEMMRRMQRFHRARIGDITAPRFDALIKNQTVSLVSDLLDKKGQILGRLAVVLSFEYRVKKVFTSSWWQRNEGFLVDDHGKIRTGTFPVPKEHNALPISFVSMPPILRMIDSGHHDSVEGFPGIR